MVALEARMMVTEAQYDDTMIIEATVAMGAWGGHGIQDGGHGVRNLRVHRLTIHLPKTLTFS